MTDSSLFAYDIGDQVILLDGEDNDPFNVGWVAADGVSDDDNMDDRIGEVLTIRMKRVEDNSVEYKVDGSDWWYSEVWLVPYSPITRDNPDLDSMLSGLM